jgi:hypothetical protein
MPAPLPPYALPILVAAARLPYSTGQHILDAASIAALLICAAYLGKITRSGTMVALLALAPIAWCIVVLGQPLILMLAALVACAALLRRGYDGWAAVCGSMMMFEPHIGLAVCASLFLWRPRARPALFTVALTLALLSTTVLPGRLTSEYFHSVLPLHAQSEAVSSLQYSTTALLSALGVPVGVALLVGGAQYALTIAFGTLVANWACSQLRDTSALVFVPSLFAGLGGTYIHDTDFLLAIPAALLLLANTRHVAIVALAAAALSPHVHVILGLPGLLLGAMCAGAMLLYLHRFVLAFVFLFALGAVAAVSGTFETKVPHNVVIAWVPPSAFADQSWAEYMRTSHASRVSLLERSPEWLALLVLCSFAASHRRPFRTSASRN